MANTPVVFNLPERTIDKIEAYCSEQHIKPSVFVGQTLVEYCSDRVKLANAVAKRITSAGPIEDSKINRMSHRVPEEACKALRALAKACYLTFDGLTRIMFDDKLNELSHQ